MFTFRDPSPYSFDAFLQDRHKVEFDQWVIDKQKAAMAASWVKPEPFDLDRMVEEAKIKVQHAIQGSKHSYRLLDDDETTAKSLGFVTVEGWSSWCQLDIAGYVLRVGDGVFIGTLTGTLRSQLDPGDYMRAVGPSGQLEWKRLPSVSDLVRLGWFVMARHHLPKFLLRFTEEIS